MPLFGPEEGGRQTKIGWSRPKTVIFWPFLAFEGRLGGLKDPLEVRVQHETYRSMSGTYVQAILSQKNWTGLAGVLRNGRNQSKYDFCSVGWPLLVKNPFFLFLVQITQKWSQMVQKWCLTVFYHFGPFLNDLDQLGSKTEKMGFLPKIANPQSKHSETRYF